MTDGPAEPRDYYQAVYDGTRDGIVSAISVLLLLCIGIAGALFLVVTVHGFVAGTASPPAIFAGVFAAGLIALVIVELSRI